MLKQRYLTACAITVLGCALAMPATAQVGGNTTPAQAEVPASQQDEAAAAPVPAGPDIVITGSLIRGSREDGAAPIDVISGDELAKQGAPSAVDLLKNLPTSNGVIGDANQFDSRSQGNEGVASVNLRGLGPQRTLVLLNGRRIVPIGGGIPIVDVNLIPSGAIGRVEVLKDGAAATYGSDAIAGVVNFITRTDQEGFLASGDYRYIQGSKGDYGGAVSYGHVGDGFRMLASFGYQHRSELRTTDRDFVNLPYPLNPQGGYTGGGNPGNFGFGGTPVFTRDLGCTGLGGFRSLPGSSTDRCFDSYGQFGNLVEPEDRFQAFVDFSADITDKLSFNATALYGRSSTRITTSPTYLPTLPPSTNAALGNGAVFVIPQYAPALRDYCALYGAASGCVTAGGVPLAPAIAFPVLFRPALLGGNPVFAQIEGNDRGSAFSKRESDSIRFTAEMRYRVTSDIDLTASGTYSQYYRDTEGTDTFGDLLQNALAGFGGPNCAYASTASRAGLTTAQLAALAGTNGCTFFNPFSTAVPQNAVSKVANPNYAGTRNPAGYSLTPGAGLINDIATIDNFFQTTRTTYDTKLYVADLVLSGKSGIVLPGGDLAFAIGAQYRRNDYTVQYNAVSNLAVNPCPGSPLNPNATCAQKTGALGFLGTNRNNSVTGDVKALFAELQLPIVQPLNLQLSARYEDYGGNVGSTFNPQARARFQVTPWLALRGGAGTTFRGPPAQQLEGNLTALQIIGTSFRAVDINGNPNLAPEKATTYSGGVIVQSGGFFASLDYFNYKLKGPIEGEPIQGIVSTLFGASGVANCNNPAYAALQARFTFTAAGCGIANVQRLRTTVFNSADVSTSGLDLQVSLRGDIGPGTLTVGANGTYVIDYKTGDITVEGIVVQPAFDGVGLLNYQTTAYPLPQVKGNWYVQGDVGAASLRLQFNYIDGYTDQRGAAIFGPNNGALAGAAVTTGKNIAPFKTMDATFRYSLNTGTSLAVTAQNIFDRNPPFARLDQNYDPFTASPLGFTLKGAITQKF
jgi:iron complex outermembrane recepter protein